MSTAIESNVRYYAQAFPGIFQRAEGPLLFTQEGRRYIDFYSGSSSLNYGHNPPEIRRALVDYLNAGGIVNAMDLDTTARRAFVDRFAEFILHPRGLDFKIMCPGPAGTNAIEAALTLARKATGRRNIFAFHGAYHGMTIGSLSATGNLRLRAQAGSLCPDVTFFPFGDAYAPGVDSISYMDAVLSDPKSGVERPAAVIVETVQAEGGVIVGSAEWLNRLAALCRRHDILLIVDDVQAGVGRTGPFFSFERCDFVPDITTLSKSLSGCGLPLSLVLFRKDLDIWSPGGYKGTFRGFQPAFVTAMAALDYWKDDTLQRAVMANGVVMEDALSGLLARLPDGFSVRGLGMIWGLCAGRQDDAALVGRVAQRCFELGLLVETAGRHDGIIKLMPPLTIPGEVLGEGLGILARAIGDCTDSAKG